MPDSPNIIVCMCDQLRAFEVGCYGNPVIRTPNLDRLAAGGVRVETAVTARPVCMAARSATLAGQFPRRCARGVGNVAYPSAPGDFAMPEYPIAGRPHLMDPTLPELLAARGYRNAAIGKWHIHSWPQDVGFHDYVIPRVHHCHTGQCFTRNGGPEFVPDGYSVDFEAAEVERFLAAQRPGAQPFFLFYNISPPHCPLSDAPERYLGLYRPTDIPIRPNVDLSRPLANQDYWFRVYRWDFRYYQHHLPHTEEVPRDYDLRQLIAHYYGLTTWVDDCVGRMLAALDAAGLSRETIVIFTSDHGDNLGSHGLVQKGSLNDESIRIPLIVRLPGGPAGRVVTEQVIGLADLAPTLLSMVGAPAAAHMHGRDVASVLTGRSQRLEENGSFVETASHVGVRTPTHLYGLALGKPPAELGREPSHFWDCANDPYQLRNLAGTTEQSAVADHLDRALRAWHRSTSSAPPLPA